MKLRASVALWLLWFGVCCFSVRALRIVSSDLSNATVNAQSELVVLVDLEEETLPVDATVTFVLHESVTMDGSTTIDTASLAATVDGGLVVSRTNQRLSLTRAGDGHVIDAHSTLTLRVLGLTMPSVVATLVLGTLESGQSKAALGPFVIQPGRLWNADLEFGHLISGRITSIGLKFTPAHSIPADGSILVHFPRIFGSFERVLLASSQGTTGMVVEAIPTGLRLRWDISSSGGVPAMQLLLFNFEDITLPLLEGSIGRYFRLETVDGSAAIVDQGAIDTSSLFLSKAQVIINKTQLYLRESAVQSGDQYSISLTAPPQYPLGVSVAITAVQSTPIRHALTIEPSVAIFSQSNWSSSVTIQVLTQNDNIAGLHDDRVVVTHTIVESSEVSFAPIENVVVYIEDDDIPLVHLSRRHVTVVEALEDDSYDIVLLSEPTDDVEIVVESVLPLVQVTPSTIVFTSNNWHVPQALLLTAQHPPPDVISGVRTQINHRVLSTDSNFNGVMARLVPQSSVHVYYEPQEMQSCIDPCRTGWFPLTNATTGASACVACPLGYYCSGGCKQPDACPLGSFSTVQFATDPSVCQPCPPGTYSYLPGSISCFSCPAGASCSHTNRQFEPCPVGMFSGPNETSCRKCPPGSFANETFQAQCQTCPQGYYCPEGSVSPLECPSGLYTSASGSSSCGACPAGYECSENLSPVPCSSGTYSLAGDHVCHTCPSGFECKATDSHPEACASGTFSLEGVGICRSCPKGHLCQDSTLPPSACVPGTYSSMEGATACVVCPAGHSCADVSTSPTSCSSASYSLEGDQLCHPCPAGSFCLDPSAAPVSCRSGSFSVGNATSCTPCPLGSICAHMDQEPVACPTGSYADISVCKICESGYFCSSPSLQPVKCPQGTFSLAGAIVCSSCPYGHTCTFPDPPVPCQSGQVHNADHSACLPCPGGYECSPLKLMTTPCPRGTFSFDGDGQCTQCPKGYECPLTAVSPIRCGSGTYAPAGSTECFSCQPGFYCPQPSMDPAPCPLWHFSTNSSTACSPCPAGKDCSSSSVAPAPCPSGTYSVTQASPCLSCPPGSACSQPAAAPVACQPGSFSLQGQAQCSKCTAGFSCPHTDQNVQLPCANGSYSEAGATVCTPCPIGKQCPVTFQKIEQACQAGTFSLGGQAACTLCPPGYKCPSVDGSLNSPCPLGSFASGGATQCAVCPAGYSCQDPRSGVPQPCVAGTFSTGGSTTCTQCPPGYACPDVTSSTKIACSPGSYSVGGAATCTPCPAGYQCLFTNTSSFSPCSPGWYSPDGAATCLECPRGFYCDNTYEMPKNCSVGSYSLKTSTTCSPCDPGYECPRSDQLPQPCPVGYYSEGAVANCRSCRPGYKCSLASRSPTPAEDACPMGGYCNPPTTFFLCPAGTYGNTTAGESVDHACAPCPEGYYCEMGSTPLTRQSCPPGFFCPEGTKRASQFPCPAGTFNPLPNQKTLDVCQLCPAGSFCDEGSGNPSTCPLGYFCPDGTRSATQYPCPAGTYSGPQTGLIIASQCQRCELGAYCPEASSTPTPCPAGTYNSLAGSSGVHECLNCPPGWSCPRVGQSTFDNRCAKGHYCPSATVLASANPCPAGTYTERIDLIRAEDCTICPLRHACPQGTGGETQTMLDCGAGFFCPNGTAYAKQFPCLPGTWSSSSSLADASECDICPVGKYCSGGKSYIDGSCSPGYYCPLGTPSPTKYPCPSGTYTSKTWLFEPSQCDDCPPGSYCPTGSVAPIPCKSGSFSSFNNTKSVGPGGSWPECVLCPAGYYCEEGSTTPQPCGKGRFSSKGAKSCSSCEAGYFCNSETTSDVNMRSDVVSWLAPGSLFGKCYNGTYCPPGSDSEPVLELDACPQSYFCPKGTPAPIVCPAGTYSNLTGQDELSDCIPTPAGYYSLEGSLQPTGECAPGFYCPERSTTRTQVPCPARYYLNRTRGQSEEDCAVCVAGSYCPRGSAYPILCPTGYYCRTGASAPEPCPIGTYSNSTGLKQVENCLACPPGMYCDSTGLTVPRGPCDPGYYCTLGSYTSAPMDFETNLFGVSNRHIGGQCPQGSYCPLGSALPSPCPSGTFNNATGLETESQCVLCSPGRFCETPGLVLPTGNCFAGFYCTGGASTPTQFPALEGYFSGNGSVGPLPCPSGQFNLYPRQEQCIDCPAGFYCGSPGTIRPIVCPQGSYCPKATALAIKCPPGTFGEVEGLISVDQCEPCPAGYYCDSYGLVTPSGKCLQGFVCIGGSPFSNPIQPEFGHVCPVGHYCPEGTGAAIQCPSGSYRPTTAGTSVASCTLCPGGVYCIGSALTAPSGSCAEGYYCKQNASTPTPTDSTSGNICPAGFFCPERSVDPIRCAAGTYAPLPGAPRCIKCPEGFYCDGTTTDRYFDCPAGFYCPEGTPAVQMPCPVGSFSPSTKLVNASQCLACSPGAYCESQAITTPTGLCSAGYLCPSGSMNAYGKTAENTTHACPTGTFCPSGSYIPTSCPVGTFSKAIGLSSRTQCVFCDEGRFCATVGLIESTGPCAAGHYCKRNCSEAAPTIGVIVVDGVEFGGDRCPLGSYCPEGSASPRLCPKGTYADQRGMIVCLDCPPGFFCPSGSTSFGENVCPQGYYCPVGTKYAVEFPCPPGVFGNRSGLQDMSQCNPAPGGMYVDTYASTKPTGLCRSGFYCSGGSSTSTPALGPTGGPCLPGTNCPEGSAVPIVCDAGFYCSSTNTEKALQCDAGFFCVQGSYTATPTGQNNSLGIIGDVCPIGHYCPQGTSNPIPCPPGTFTENTQNQRASDCFLCPPGYICSLSGISSPFEKCPPGFLCTGGEREATIRCPKGHECKEGSSQPQLCPAGTFSDEDGLGRCKVCPERYYCEQGCITPQPCPVGYYCPIHTSASTTYPCQPGRFSNQTLLAGPDECMLCPPGKFCSGQPPADRPTGDCAPGFFCSGGAASAAPVDGITGDFCAGGHVCYGGASISNPIDGVTGGVCTPGFYCPRGSSTAIRCIKGTYNPAEKQAVCTICPAGGYCDTNSTAPAPCPTRYYCPEGTLEPILCPSGTYGHAQALERSDQCAPCLAGKFCVGGTLTASCAAGYYCKLYNTNPNPSFLLSDAELANKSLGFDFGGPCPVGHYCPEGVLDPIPCPNSTARMETHGTSVDDCGLCPAGMSCDNGAITVPCPPGYYCPYANSAIPCPRGSYNPAVGQSRLEDCLPCDGGKICNRTAMIDLTNYDCPAGNYCLRGESRATPCPPGRYRRSGGGKNVLDCTLCDGGAYCDGGTIDPITCGNSTYCPPGSGQPLACPGGSYCPYNSSLPVSCPPGFFCPMPVALPTPCERGFYCPKDSIAPLACPLGYIGRKTPLSGLLSDLESACESCPPGMYGTDPNRTICEVCPAGYVCLEATRSSRPQSKLVDNGYPCPSGYYCPAGSSKELPCPSGTYQPNTQAQNYSACRPCPVDSYQNREGQSSCLPCSTSSYAADGATKCTCKGSHRAFQMTDGYCICEPGYEFYDQDLILRSDEDDDVDCQPIVYDRCRSNQVRLDDGICVSASDTSCEKSCSNGAGKFVSSLGLCQCDKQVDVDTICDEACREKAPQVQVNSSTGTLQLYDPVSGSIEPLSTGTASGVISKISCADGKNCQLHSLAIGSSGFSGSYDLPSSITTKSNGGRRRLDTSSTSLANPMVCLPVGGGILFDLSTPGSYPIYQKDSMLNTNPNFDYGAFRSLAARVRANTTFVSAFAFSFTEPGTYVFSNSLNSAAKTVITVMKEGTTCPVEAPIVPLSEKNLIAVSAKRRTDDLILAPDWALIIGLLGGLIGMVVAVIVGLYYFRTKSWTTSGFRNRLTGYRAKNKQTDLSTVHSKGSLLANKAASPTAGASREEKLTPAPVMMLDEAQDRGAALSSPRWAKLNNGARGEYEPDLGRWDEEDVDLRELVDRLQFHHEAVTKCFDDQKDDVQKLLQHLQLEAAELKRLFVNAVASTGPHHSNEIHRMEIRGDSINHNPEETATDMADLPLDKGEHVVLETLRTDLADRRRFRSRRETGFEQVAKLLCVIEGWGRNNGDLPRSLVDDMAMATNQDEPESTTPNGERVNTYLKHVHSVLGDLKTLLSSDPLTVTSSSVVQLADSEKIRREISEMVLDAAQRQIQCSKPSDGSDGASSSMLEILLHHENVARAENKEDEVMREEMQPLQKFGVALPKLIGALETMETNFQNELAQLREEQNPSKEVISRLQMEERINQFIKELAKSAGRLQDRRQKGRQKLTKAKQLAVQREEELERSLLAASEHHAAMLEQRAEARRQALASKKAEAGSVLPTATSGLALNDDTLSQIKELLVRLAQHPNASGLSTFLPAQGQVESSPLDSLLAPIASDVVRLLPVQWKQEPTISQSLATEELAVLRKTAEEEAQVLLERQEAMQHEYRHMLQTQFPGLSPEEKAKLLRDFGMDLTHLESAVKMEAYKTETDVQNLLTARAVLNEKQKENVARLDEQQKQALDDDQRHQERQLESQFTDEEQAIESEYQQELARLAQEFGVLEESDMMELPLETEEIESEGDEWIYDDAGDAMLPTDTIEEEDESDEQILSDSVEDVRFRTSRARGSTDMFALREAMEKELSSNIDEIRNIYAAYQQELFRAVDSEAAHQQERLRQRLASRREQLGLMQAPKDLSDQDQELEHEQAMSLEAIAADIAARKLSIDQKFDLKMAHLPGILNALTNSHTDEIEALLAECCAKHAAGRKKLVDDMKQERQTQEQSLEARLSKRREQQKFAIAAGVSISDAELLESDHQERVTLENELEATERREIALFMEKRDADLRSVSDSFVAKLTKQSATAKQEKKDLELALQRVLEDHRLGRSQLQMKLEAEGTAERTRLQQRLAKGREESKALSAASDPEAKRLLDEEAYSEEVALETKLACAAKDSSQAERNQHAALELELMNSISEAACRISASDAACVATREAIERETKKLWEEFDGARLRDTNDEADAGSLRRQRLRDRLNAMQTGRSGPVDRVEGGWSDPTKTLSAVESTLSKAVNDEIAGIRKCFDESLKHRQKQLERESAMRKKQLEERLHRKRRNTDNRAADAELVKEEAAELAAIDDHMAHQLVSMGQDTREQQSQLELTMKQTIADKARDVEDLLEACRQDYATQHGDLVRRMAQECVLREEMLRERLRLRRLQPPAEDENATQGEIPGIDGRDKMEHELQAELRVAEEKLCSEQLAAVRQIISDSSESSRERLPAKKAEVETIEEELQRIRNEHAREYDALQSALNAERSQKELRLKEKLESRRNMRLRQLDATKDPDQHAQVLQALQKEEDMQLMQLSEQLTQTETHVLAQKLAEAVTREKECESRLLEAVVDTGASVATGRVLQAMEEEELVRVRRAFERGQQERVNVDQLDAVTHRSRLSDRLRDKKARRGPETSTMAVSKESVLKPAGSEQSEMADALDVAVEIELQRVRESHAASMMAHQLQLRQEAELQKALLRERMARKRAAALSVAVSNSREEAGYDSEVMRTIAVEEARALTQIDQHVTDELTRLQAFSTAQASHTRNHTEIAAEQNAEEIDRLIESCRAGHAKEALVLCERLKQERDRQEMTLRDRLSKRRTTRLGDTTPADPTTMEKLLKEEQQDLGDLDTHLRKQEASAQQEMQLRHRREVSACTQEAERIMAQREEDAKNDEEAVMRELVRLREDHQRAQNELKAEIEAYRKRQAERLQASLARRQAEKDRRLEKAGTNDEILAIKAVADAEDEMEKLKMDEDVLRYTEEARGAMRSRHLEKEHKLLLRQNEASAKAIAAAAARKATEVAREAELKRIAVEYNAGRANNQADDDSEAARRKQRLQDRVAAKKTNKQKMVIEQSSVTDSDLVKEDTPSATVAEKIDHAMEDAIERLRRQHASNMQQRISDLEAEKELRKSQLRVRMEQRRQALRLKAGAEMNEAAVMVEEQALEAQEQQELVAIERNCELMKRQLDEETSRSQAHLLEQAGNASKQHAEEIERLLAACRATHDEQMDALQNSLALERARREKVLQDRLSKKRAQRQVELDAYNTALTPDAVTIAQAALEEELLSEEEKARKDLLRKISDKEAMELKQAQAQQQRELENLSLQEKERIDANQAKATLTKEAAERELLRVKDEHERERLTLEKSIAGERKRQELKLQEKLSKRRAQHQQEIAMLGDSDAAAQMQNALEAEERLEHLKLEEEMDKKASRALEEDLFRQQEQERALEQQVHQASLDSAAADAARQALEVARKAEVDHITHVFESTRRDALTESDAEATTQHSKLEQRLAEKRRTNNRRSVVSAGKKVRVITRLSSIAERQAQQEIERLQNEHSEAWQERCAGLEAEAALRKARLAERIAKRRAELAAASTSVDNQQAQESVLQQEEEAELQAINQQLEMDKKLMLDEITRNQEQVTAALHEAAKRNAEEMEKLLTDCKETHAQESKQLAESLELERQRQERALQERIARRKNQRASKQEQQQTITHNPKSQDESLEVRPSSADEELKAERERRELRAQLDAKEQQAWEEMRRKQEEELNELTKQAEAIALKKQEDAKLLQESAQAELDRLKQEHESEMNALTASLEVEQKRQQQQLQQRIAQRRQQKQNESQQQVLAKEQLAKQLEEQERLEKIAMEELEAKFQAEVARKVEEERERQRIEEAEVAARLAQASIDAAAADAARKAMDATREIEIERLASEFEEKSRELRQSHMADLLAQKQKLEARVAAKKQKKLMELEAKKEMERLKLQQKQHEEQERMQVEQAQVQNALEAAVAMASTGDGDTSLPPDSQVEIPPDEVRTATPAPHVEASDELARQSQEEAEAAEVAKTIQQQEKDTAAIQQLFETRIIPQRMPLINAIDYILSGRHQKETSLLFATQYKAKTVAIREVLRDIMQQKAAQKAMLIKNITSPSEQENQVKELDDAYDAKIREVEQRTLKNMELQHQTEAKRLKDHQLAQVEFLLKYFNTLYVAAVSRAQQEADEEAQRLVQVAKLRVFDSDEDVDRGRRQLGRLRRRNVGDNDDTEDLIDQLRARLQVEADERILQLYKEKESDLRRLSEGAEAAMQQISDEFDRLVEAERVNIEHAHSVRLSELPSSATAADRDVLVREKEAQFQSLVLMLRGRRSQREAIEKQAATKQVRGIEDDCERRVRVVEAKMMERLVEEKEMLRKKLALAKTEEVTEAKTVARDDEEEAGAEEDTPSVIDRPSSPLILESGRKKVESAVRRATLLRSIVNESEADNDLRQMLKSRLQTIESLLQEKVSLSLDSKKTQLDETEDDNEAYKLSIRLAIQEACGWVRDLEAEHCDGEGTVILEAKQQRLDFANALVHMLAPTNGEPNISSSIRRVMLSTSLLPSLKQLDSSSQTLFLHSSCLEKLTAGQLAMLVLHAVVEAQTQTSDVADPEFIACLHRLLQICYQNLYDKSSQMNGMADELASNNDSKVVQSASSRSAHPRRPGGEWQSHLFQVESFLAGIDHTLRPDISDGVVTPRTGSLRRQPTVMLTGLEMARNSSRLSLKDGETPNEMEALMLQERRQFLLEKLDTSEKLYTQVLRQHQEQKESLEYIQEMLVEEQEQEPEGKQTREEKAAHVKQIEELHHEVEAMETSLDKTRQERDELFRQCQSLRDELASLPQSRPPTATGVGSVPVIAEAKTDG